MGGSTQQGGAVHSHDHSSDRAVHSRTGRRQRQKAAARFAAQVFVRTYILVFGQGFHPELGSVLTGSRVCVACCCGGVCNVCTQVGGIRRIVVPVELGYPDNNYRKQGPKPTTFSVRRGAHSMRRLAPSTRSPPLTTALPAASCWCCTACADSG